MRIALFATMPKDTYSGGRYYSFMLAEALAAGGHEVYYCTNHQPVFYTDLAAFPDHGSIHLVLTDDFITNLPEDDFDAVFLTPGTSVPGFYDLVEVFAIDRSAHLVFINFESGNWFNALSPVPKPLSTWTPWKKASRCASVILSISQEGNTWAKDFYTDSWEHTRFEYCYPSVNTPAADSVVDIEVGNRILLFMRFSTSLHKGSADLDQLFCEAMRGYTLVIVLGKEEVPTPILERLLQLARQFDVRLEFKQKLSDIEKFQEFKRAKLVLFPSQFEGYGYPPVEAQYCNVNCVAFDLPVLRETCADRLYLAERGNWSDLRHQITRALEDLHDSTGYRAAIEPIASLRTATERLNVILEDMRKQELPSRQARRIFLLLQQRFLVNDFGLRMGQRKIRVRNFLLRCAGAVVRRLHRFRRKSRRVVYYPAFDTTADLSNHYHRACWYLPYVENHCQEVLLYQSCGDTVEPLSEYMAAPPVEPKHIHIRSGKLLNLIALLRSDLIVIWKKGQSPKYLKFLGRFCGISVVNVATDDLGSKEYGAYCSLIWSYLTSIKERNAYLVPHEQRFNELAARLHAERFDKACLFGTGPSLAKARDFEYGHSLNIVCNSIVQDEGLLDLLKPKFICAGDVVSHLGVSAYAHRFREDLIKALRERDMVFVTTANFGALFLYHYPDLEDKVLLLPQNIGGPNYDLCAHYGVPRLDSTLNIHMFPLAATFAKMVWILGCDGKKTEVGEEDFWAHAEQAQYYDLVDSGHLCHPTFDMHRQLTMYDGFLRSTERTIEEGEEKHGIRYRTLVPSNIPCLKDRTMDRESGEL